jgi:hypothetical protein
LANVPADVFLGCRRNKGSGESKPLARSRYAQVIQTGVRWLWPRVRRRWRDRRSRSDRVGRAARAARGREPSMTLSLLLRLCSTSRPEACSRAYRWTQG